MKKAKPIDRWKAVLNGKIYCAPACGGKCTKAEHDDAQEAAEILVSLLGPGWKPRVWENMGWHYGAEIPAPRKRGKNIAEIHPPYGQRGRYWVSINAPQQVTAEHKDPVQAVIHATELADALASQLMAAHYAVRQATLGLDA